MVAAHYKKDSVGLTVSGYHADIHKGHGTVGAGQGRGRACVNARHGNGMAWALHAVCESALTVTLTFDAAYPK